MERKKGARRGGEEEEECIFLFLSVIHEQMYTGLLSFVYIDINSFFFFSSFLKQTKKRMTLTSSMNEIGI